MKKILLGLGTLSLITLPGLIVISGSGASTTTPTMDTETSKLKTQKTLSTEENSSQAATLINEAIDQEAKNIAFKTYYSEVKLANGFKYDVKLATVSSTTELSVIVNIIDSRNINNIIKSKDIVIIITGFKTGPYILPSEFQTELIKIEDTRRPNGTTGTVQLILQEIANAGNDISAKTEIIKRYMLLTDVVAGFEVEYVDAIIGETNNTTLEITFKLRNNNQFSEPKNIYVFDFEKPANFFG